MTTAVVKQSNPLGSQESSERYLSRGESCYQGFPPLIPLLLLPLPTHLSINLQPPHPPPPTSIMLFYTPLLALASLVVVNASPLSLSERATCSSYTIVSTRGTGEPQGPSTGYRSMISQLKAAVPGGTEVSSQINVWSTVLSLLSLTCILFTLEPSIVRYCLPRWS